MMFVREQQPPMLSITANGRHAELREGTISPYEVFWRTETGAEYTAPFTDYELASAFTRKMAQRKEKA